MNTLKRSVEGANKVISESSKNQSKDRNVSEADPKILAGVNVSVTDSGNLKLKDKATVISCK